MACDLHVLREIPLFALLDDEELAVLAEQVELASFAPRQRIYRIGDPGEQAYVMIAGAVRVTTIDDDHQDVIVDEPSRGEFFGLASMLDETPHQTNAIALEETTCLRVDRHDILALLQQKPHAGMDMLTVLGRQVHAAQQPFIITFLVGLTVYTAINLALRSSAWDPYPFILLNLFLSMLAALQAPVIMMSQNRQDTKDRLRGELDYDVNRRAETEIQGLAHKLNLIHDKIADLDDVIQERFMTGRRG